MATLQEGKIIGENNAIFDSNPRYQVETFSYCTLGQFNQEDILEVVIEFPFIKDRIIERAVGNLFDLDKQFFIEAITRVPYFNSLSSDVLSLLFEESEMISLEMDDILFKFNTKCQYLYIVVQGVILVELTDGN